jgi:hypothetical protein
MAGSRRTSDPRRAAKGAAARPRKPKRAGKRAATPVNESPAMESPATAAVPEERLALVERVQAMVERQIEGTEAIMPLPETPGDAERNGRALASLLRTLRELKRLEAPPAPTEPADDDIPYDLEELRRELSRKLEAIVAGREGAVRYEP